MWFALAMTRKASNDGRGNLAGLVLSQPADGLRRLVGYRPVRAAAHDH